MVSLATERLVLRQWHSGDVNPFSELCGDPEVMSWIGDGSTRTPQECLRIVGTFQSAWARDGFGLFAVEDCNSQRFIGFCGLSVPEFLPEILPAVEIGWRLGRSSWGKGFATEAARACVDFAFSQAGLERLVCIYQIGNEASARIIKKLRMTGYRETIDPSCGRRVTVCELNRSVDSPDDRSTSIGN